MKMKVICQEVSIKQFLTEYESSYLHSILQLGDQRVGGNELKEATLHLEGHGHDEGTEEQHLEHEKCEDLFH